MKQKDWRMSIQSYIYSTIDHAQSSTKRLFTWSFVNRQSTMYDTKQRSYWHSSNRHSIEASDRSFSTWHFIHSSILLLHLVRSHVNERMTIQLRRSVQSLERARNKNITRDRSDEYHTSRSRSLHSEIVDWLAHFIILFQMFNQNLIWSWMIYIACFLRSRNQWICNNIKCARVLRVVLTIAIQLLYSFWSHTNSHYVISHCDDFICFQNDQIRDLQIYTCSRKSFASILDSDSLLDFSILNDLSIIFNLQISSKTFRHSFV